MNGALDGEGRIEEIKEDDEKERERERACGRLFEPVPWRLGSQACVSSTGPVRIYLCTCTPEMKGGGWSEGDRRMRRQHTCRPVYARSCSL